MREEQEDTKHYYDVWHVAKGLAKKMEALAKKPGCGELRDWIKSISNHLYWCASSNKDGDKEVLLAKWLSIMNHIQNIHEGHDNEKFPRCAHEVIDESERKKKWLKPSTKVTEKVNALLTNKRLQTDVKKLSPLHQTSSVEAFHSLIVHFCPKSTHFSYLGMKSRLALAALHYNENSSRPVAKTSGDACTIIFPKFKQGGFSIQKSKPPATYKYLTDLTEKLCDEVVCDPARFGKVLDDINVPPPLATKYVRPNKQEAVANWSKRFNST
ncbi:uncharacterized protein LOC135493645 [Lineus longissimus]|uniref:uncharacterized protein LOC135493645 n=1 Tax=Lineus longissimus TaxID=88925 RepID=UPI00315D138F